MSEITIPQTAPYAEELAPGKYWWCACGRSATQPLCDGSHKTTDITPVPFEVAETKTVYLCGCKHTATPPYCDGSHEFL
ncbi:CDGSH iron-sulfur domain-containing protein [Methylogaea oryzae]|uniref:Iron-binding zinc finger CDGSH type domain-containing protein n=1 Tax=Methylogaea oryzae TaxID=1295382 RepID=A0A8D5AIF3_9GAMM|nr:CDGSH iron-sulfur domain-containing protein [Methylogaea oryzae]BBL71291.1 hypothetical protein MoryE10_18970 [Methylogaea oryzae]